MNINIVAARNAGYSDDEIFERISKKYPGALKAMNAGYSLDDVVERINKREQAEPKEPEAPEEPEKKTGITAKVGSAISGAFEKGGEFLGGAVEHPVVTAGGILGGAIQGVGKVNVAATRPVMGNVKRSFQNIPTEEETAAMQSADVMDIGAGRFTSPVKAATERPLTESQEKQLEAAQGVGEFAGKIGYGAALATAIPGGGGLPVTMARGTVTNLPFVAEAYEKGGADAALKDIWLNAIIDATTHGVGKFLEPVKKTINKKFGAILKSIGEKIEISTLKPTKPVLKDVYVPKGKEASEQFLENVYKHGLEGNLEQAHKKIISKFDDLTAQLKNKISDSGAKIDIADTFINTMEDLKTNPAKSFGSNQKMENIVNEVLGEIELIAPNGVVDIADAQDIKRAVGAMGAWVYGVKDSEATAREKVYNAFYTKLKEAIEKNAPEGVKEINREISELIPIEKAIIHRLPVAKRNDLISLTDVIATTGAILSGPKGWGLAVINKISKSPAAGARAYRMGEKIAGKEIRSSFMKRNVISKFAKEQYKEEEEDDKKPLFKGGRHF